jgi:hypothetical protein
VLLFKGVPSVRSQLHFKPLTAARSCAVPRDKRADIIEELVNARQLVEGEVQEAVEWAEEDEEKERAEAASDE